MKKLLSLSLLLASGQLFADPTVNFYWQPPTEGEVPTGYELYIGTSSGYYDQQFDVGNSPTMSFQLGTLQYGITYYAVMTSYLGPSYEARTKESVASNEVEFVPTPQGGSYPPGEYNAHPSLVAWIPEGETQDGVLYNMGVKFTLSQRGHLVGGWFWKAVDEPATTRNFRVYSYAGRPIGSTEFTPTEHTGWQYVPFNTPIPVNAGTTYTAATTRFYYGYKTTSFPISNGPVSVEINGGVYGTNISSMPTLFYNNSDYGTDIVFIPSP